MTDRVAAPSDKCPHHEGPRSYCGCGLPLPGEQTKPYRIWSLPCPFRKDGVPVMGNLGSTIESVIIMRHETFKRLCAEHPSLLTAQFEVGTYGE